MTLDPWDFDDEPVTPGCSDADIEAAELAEQARMIANGVCPICEEPTDSVRFFARFPNERCGVRRSMLDVRTGEVKIMWIHMTPAEYAAEYDHPHTDGYHDRCVADVEAGAP